MTPLRIDHPFARTILRVRAHDIARRHRAILRLLVVAETIQLIAARELGALEADAAQNFDDAIRLAERPQAGGNL